ncbi:MAG TPA: hypothetical protein PKA27_12790 [Fimbriimonadaceae bacterium]|nr:hypothetical protein [Fimbriimonadaceae bacterium]
MQVRDAASFRDPAGYVFYENGKVFRKVAPTGVPDFEAFVNSGLKGRLEESEMLVRSTPVAESEHGLVLECDEMWPITYPYEWGFSELKSAAVLTLQIAEQSLTHDLSLKDASGYNIQFRGNRPVFIDILSFESYRDGQPWQAYGQFCRHFLAPLALASKVDIRLLSLLRSYIDGIPLDLAAELLPGATRLNGGLLTHIHLHAKATMSLTSGTVRSVPRVTLLALLDSLRRTVESLTWTPRGIWANYYSETNYDTAATNSKHEIVRRFLRLAGGETCLDLGANDGTYSAIAKSLGMRCVLSDSDYGALEGAFKSGNGVAVYCDLANPSPNQGWHGYERSDFFRRFASDTVLALALIHHLRIGNNTPLSMITRMLASLGNHLIVEFVPKEDSQVQRMLETRADIFDDYNEVDFRSAFEQDFEFVESASVTNTSRTLHLLRRK